MEVSLVMFKADGSAREFVLEHSRTIIGRKNTCDLRIPLNAVSRQHCELRATERKLVIRDLGSSNGTFHNGQRVQEAQLKAGDRLQIGPVVFTVVIDGEPSNLDPSATLLESAREVDRHVAGEDSQQPSAAPRPTTAPERPAAPAPPRPTAAAAAPTPAPEQVDDLAELATPDIDPLAELEALDVPGMTDSSADAVDLLNELEPKTEAGVDDDLDALASAFESPAPTSPARATPQPQPKSAPEPEPTPEPVADAAAESAFELLPDEAEPTVPTAPELALEAEEAPLLEEAGDAAASDASDDTSTRPHDLSAAVSEDDDDLDEEFVATLDDDDENDDLEELSDELTEEQADAVAAPGTPQAVEPFASLDVTADEAPEAEDPLAELDRLALEPMSDDAADEPAAPQRAVEPEPELEPEPEPVAESAPLLSTEADADADDPLAALEAQVQHEAAPADADDPLAALAAAVDDGEAEEIDPISALEALAANDDTAAEGQPPPKRR